MGYYLIMNPQEEETFVTRKITRGIARINAGIDNCIFVKTWIPWEIGAALDFVEMQWLMLQQDKAEDSVIATGQQISVREFIGLACQSIGWGGINGKVKVK